MTVKRRLLLLIILYVFILGWWNTPDFMSAILHLTGNEVKLLAVYLLAIILIPLPENFLVIIAAIFLLGSLLGEFAGLIIFVSLIVFLYKLVISLTKYNQG